MRKARTALQGRIIREGDEFNGLMPGKLTSERAKGIAITDKANPCPNLQVIVGSVAANVVHAQSPWR